MSLDELEQEVEAKNQEANFLAKRLGKSVNAYELAHRNIIKEYLRKKLAADISKETRRVLEDIQTHEERLRRDLEFTRDVWVHGFRFLTTDRLAFGVVSTAFPDSQKLRMERIVLAEDFRSRLDSLVSSIEQGAMDDELDVSPGEAIWVHVLDVDQQG